MTTNDWQPVPGGAHRIPAVPQSNAVVSTSPAITNLLMLVPPFSGMDLKRFMFSVIATSVGSRSMLDAPKKPTTPVVRSST